MIRIRYYRERMGLTMYELGQKVGCTESAISNYELGKRKPDYEMLLKISEVLETDVMHLIGRAEAGEEEEIPEITMIARAGKRMTPERRQDMLKMLKIAFPDAFKEE